MAVGLTDGKLAAASLLAWVFLAFHRAQLLRVRTAGENRETRVDGLFMEGSIGQDLWDYPILVVGNLTSLGNYQIDFLLLSSIVALGVGDCVPKRDRDDVGVCVVMVLTPTLVLGCVQQDDVVVVLPALAVVHVEERVGVHAADVHGQLSHPTLEMFH